MKSKQIEAYNYYKRLYPCAIVLFHINASYVALFDDANTIAKFLNNRPGKSTDWFEFPHTDVGTISALGERFQLHLIDYRNDDGEFDFPDIKRLKKEKSEDY